MSNQERLLRILKSDLADSENPAVVARHPHLGDPQLIADLRARVAALEQPTGPGPCARRVVTCTLIRPDGLRFVGTNWCRNAQPACPRAEGEGYEKCITICQQRGHAEEDAVINAGPLAAGAHAYVENHTYACRNCQETLFAAGIAAFTIGPPPEKI